MKEIFNIMIVEDKKIQASALASLINEWQEKNISYRFSLSICNTVNDVRTLMDELMESDLIFMDIELDHPSLNGLNISDALRKRNFKHHIIIVTSHDEYLEAGYDIDALQFIIKPASLEKIDKVMKKFIRKIRKEFFTIKIDSYTHTLDCNSIYYFTVEDHYITSKSESKSISFRSNISQLSTQLPDMFIQCHKSYIVNIEKIYSFDRSNIKLINDASIPIGRKYFSDVKERYSKFLD